MENEKQEVITDAMRIAKWNAILATFKKVIDGNPTPESVKDTLSSLSEAAMTTNLLTGGQKDGIVARCRNYMNGTYGVNKAKTDYISSNSKS